MTKSITFLLDGVVPPAHNPRTSLEQPPGLLLPTVKLPKSVKFPRVAIVQKSITSLTDGVNPP